MTPSLKNEFGDRLLTLSTGELGLRTLLQVKMTTDEKDADLLHMRASDESLDRYDEVIAAEGWQLDHYQRNPVIQNSHNYHDLIFTIGKAERTWIEGGALLQTWRFASKENPAAKIARDLYRGGFLNASSVGFIPREWINGDKQSKWRRKYTKAELLEVSAVSIPANPNALANGLREGAVAKSDVKELLDLLKSFCSDKADAPLEPSARGGAFDGAQFLRDARSVADAMRGT